ncbi:DNA methyltransferase [Adhaeribacter soli]|uniref:DNA methylase n=1 Tax=Adhaeribacter soli TaxID=2607655 RepID=A0A5N1IRY1_9BACT|nr:DNA methyltransferase [Adhaeribacter soli]KAA9332671.1 DNA methylase [Adhaeribacter soli]
MTKDKILCLGKEFTTEEERRAFFRSELRAKLPDLKSIDGFPFGEDEDIIELSDPPYYTACPNPWLNDFVFNWETKKAVLSNRMDNFLVSEPYSGDVNEGKNNPIYNAHGYHTKVPHPAVMRYILHYTQPGDIVLDGFAGTGMAGVAAQLCAFPDPETHYRIENEFKDLGLKPPVWGTRNAILSDLSPIASFIAYNYNTPKEADSFKKETQKLMAELEAECGWMYETFHTNAIKGRINYTIWSSVFSCPQCSGEIVFWETAIDKDKGAVLDEFLCPHCGATQSKRQLDKAWVTIFDSAINQSIRQAKIVPVLINYTVSGKRFEKVPDENDIALIRKIEELEIPFWFPKDRMPEGDEARRNDRDGITHLHHFYTKRNNYVIASIWEKASKIPHFRWAISGIIQRANKQHQIAVSRVGGEKANAGGKTAGHRRGTLYIPSIQVEFSVFELIYERLKIIQKALLKRSTPVAISTQSSTKLQLKDESVDYIFVDPPFGANIMYSELNFLWEGWLKVKTNNKKEAIENRFQGKSLFEYQFLIESCFHEFYRVLRPGKWMTVEFSNTSASVWNSIQNALQRVGFIVSNVSFLNKKQETHSARTSSTAVKQDLVISCYKPSKDFVDKIESSGSEVIVWDFISEHLQHLPVHSKREKSTTAIIERSPKILYDRLITFYLMRGLPIPINAKEFQDGLKQRFATRDDMFFTSVQAAEYDEKKALAPNFVQLALIIGNESDAIEWLKSRLRSKPQKYNDIMPDFRIATQSLRKGDTLPELQEILNENFIQETDGSWRTPDPSEAKDREILRTKVLLKEFNEYIAIIKQPKAKKLKEVRVESLRTGFKNCWDNKDFKTILELGDMIPQNILLEDEKLLMYYDIAKDRV